MKPSLFAFSTSRKYPQEVSSISVQEEKSHWYRSSINQKYSQKNSSISVQEKKSRYYYSLANNDGSISESYIENLSATHPEHKEFLSKILDAYGTYISDLDENKVNKFSEPEIVSFAQLLRFIPELPEENLSVYLDEETGCFGVVIKPNKKKKQILNLLMKENREVIFSFITNKNDIVKITGKAYFSDHLDDSDEIKRIIGLIDL